MYPAMADHELNLKQEIAYLSPATEILYGGAAGGGKSHLMRLAAISWCMQVPGLQVYLFRRISDDLIKNHIEGPSGFPVLVGELVMSGYAKIVQSPTTQVQFWNGSKIHLCHCQYEKDRFKYQGAEIHVLLIDELTHFSEVIYRYLRGRCRVIGLDIPKQFAGKFPCIINGSNPGGVGHNWVKATFIDVAPPFEIRRAPKDEGGMLRQYIPARMDDNPDLMLADPDYGDRLEGLGNPALIKAMREGSWDIVAGGMFDDVWNAERHILKPFDVPRSWRIDRSFDWGSSRPFSVGWWAESDGTEATMPDGTRRAFPKGSLLRIGEWYGWNGKANQGCRMLATEIARGILIREIEMGIKGRVMAGPADSAIFATENGNCIADDMLRIGVRWEAADKSPGSRVNGWEYVRKMLKGANQERPEYPGMWVFDTCRHFIRTLPVLPRDERKQDDVDSSAEDHIADEVRYRASAKNRAVRLASITGL